MPKKGYEQTKEQNAKINPNFGMKGKHHTSKTKDIIRNNLIKNIKKGKYNKKPNKPELFLDKLIKKNNLPFNYVGDGKIWFKGQNHSFNPDFLSKNPKHIIEMFGDYWHKNTQKEDKKRLKTYLKYGYKTLVIWEHELKNPNQVVNKINSFIK